MGVSNESGQWSQFGGPPPYHICVFGLDFVNLILNQGDFIELILIKSGFGIS